MELINKMRNETLKLIGYEIDLCILESFEGIFPVFLDKLSCDVSPSFKVIKYDNVPILKIFNIETRQEKGKLIFEQKFQRFNNKKQKRKTK